METQGPPSPPPPPTPKAPSCVDDYHWNVDTSRPFRSVKEAVAMFGERILVGEIYPPNPHPCPSSSSSSSYNTTTTNNNNNNNQLLFTSSSPPLDNEDVDVDGNINIESLISEGEGEGDGEGNDNINNKVVLDTLKRLESELEDTKAELKQLKDREQETEVALASLNAELHRNMSRLAQAEAAEAAALASALPTTTTTITKSPSLNLKLKVPAPEKDDQYHMRSRITRRRRSKELMKSMQKNTTLAQILSLENDAFFSNSKAKDPAPTKTMIIIKNKPIVPLLPDLCFFRKKTSSSSSFQFSSNPHLLYHAS